MNKLKSKMLILFLLIGVVSGFAQAPIRYTCYNIDGYWGEWRDVSSDLKITGTYSSFVIHQNYYHPSEYGCKITIYGYDENLNKIARKQKKEYCEYNGSIEIFLSSGNNVRDWVKSFTRIFGVANYHGDTYSKAVSYPAKIRIDTYRKRPKTYTVIFEKCAIAFSLY